MCVREQATHEQGNPSYLLSLERLRQAVSSPGCDKASPIMTPVVHVMSNLEELGAERRTVAMPERRGAGKKQTKG